MNALTIGTTAIRQLDGLYSLNDLHQAAGGEEKTRPNQFMRIDQTKALIAEISNAQMCAFKTQRGGQGGTYVCRELVYAYANWISPAFYLKMIRAFDAMQKVGAGETVRNLREQMLTATSAPTLLLPTEIQGAIDARAMVLTLEAHALLREFLTRRVAYTCEIGNPRQLAARKAMTIVAETTLDMALAPKHYNVQRGILDRMETLAIIASECYVKMTEEIGRGVAR